MLQDKDNFKAIMSQHSCNYTKEGRNDNCSNILGSSNYIKQLKQQQYAQICRNKHYKQSHLYKCEAQVTIFSWDITAYILLQLE